MAQVQCPNCGGFKVDEKRRVRYPKSGKLDTDYGQGCYVAFMLVAGFVLGSLALWWQDTLFFGIVVVAVIVYLIGAARMSNYPRVYSCSCQLCGYRWTWERGQPEPEPHVRPDLIQQGMQKLEEEEKKRRRQEEAAHWLHQQRKK